MSIPSENRLRAGGGDGLEMFGDKRMPPEIHPLSVEYDHVIELGHDDRDREFSVLVATGPARAVLP